MPYPPKLQYPNPKIYIKALESKIKEYTKFKDQASIDGYLHVYDKYTDIIRGLEISIEIIKNT